MKFLRLTSRLQCLYRIYNPTQIARDILELRRYYLYVSYPFAGEFWELRSSGVI
jgi:hypothetical protein